MKKCLLFIFIIFVYVLSYSQSRDIQENFQFNYIILTSTGGFVAGQSPTLKIQKASDSTWLDFNDNTFKSSSITNLTTTLTTNTTGQFYYYVFNPTTTETTAEDYKFVVDNVDATYGDHQSQTVSYLNTANYVWEATTSSYNTDGAFGGYMQRLEKQIIMSR